MLEASGCIAGGYMWRCALHLPAAYRCCPTLGWVENPNACCTPNARQQYCCVVGLVVCLLCVAASLARALLEAGELGSHCVACTLQRECNNLCDGNYILQLFLFFHVFLLCAWPLLSRARSRTISFDVGCTQSLTLG